MKHYRDSDGSIHAFEDDGSQDFLIKDSMTLIPKKEINAIRKNEQTNAFDSLTYAQKRATEYPKIGDQLDALFHAGILPKELTDKIQAIKDKYPKA